MRVARPGFQAAALAMRLWELGISVAQPRLGSVGGSRRGISLRPHLIQPGLLLFQHFNNSQTQFHQFLGILFDRGLPTKLPPLLDTFLQDAPLAQDFQHLRVAVDRSVNE